MHYSINIHSTNPSDCFKFPFRRGQELWWCILEGKVFHDSVPLKQVFLKIKNHSLFGLGNWSLVVEILRPQGFNTLQISKILWPLIMFHLGQVQFSLWNGELSFNFRFHVCFNVCLFNCFIVRRFVCMCFFLCLLVSPYTNLITFGTHSMFGICKQNEIFNLLKEQWIHNGNRTEWSPIRSVIRVITKSDDREAVSPIC